jgi:hypothetical protein
MGATMLTGTRVTGLEACASGRRLDGDVRSGTAAHTTFDADYVWSTIPTPMVARMMKPPAPPR